jgi:hypothetical protein
MFNDRMCKMLLKNKSLQLNVKVQWNNIKKCVVDIISDLFGKQMEESKGIMNYTGNYK